MVLGVVVQSLKPVKLLAACKGTQQLPTLLAMLGVVGCWELLGPLHVAKDSLVAVFSRHATLLPPLRDETKTAARETGKGEKGEKWRVQLKRAAAWAGFFEAGLRYPRVSAKFELKYESLKSKSSLILFTYNLMIGYSKKNRENYPRKCFR